MKPCGMLPAWALVRGSALHLLESARLPTVHTSNALTDKTYGSCFLHYFSTMGVHTVAIALHSCYQYYCNHAHTTMTTHSFINNKISTLAMAAAPASSLMLLYSLMLLSSWAFCTNSAKEVQALMEQPTFCSASSSSAGCNHQPNEAKLLPYLCC